MGKSLDLNKLSNHLFWDSPRENVDIEQHAAWLIQRVLEYGKRSDWELILEYYTLPVIVKHAKGLRSLDDRSLDYIANLSHTPIEEFRCYKYRQLNRTHWGF